MSRPHRAHRNRPVVRGAACALLLALALLPWRAVPAAGLPTLTPVPRSSRFT